jgi:hypothetical protein
MPERQCSLCKKTYKPNNAPFSLHAIDQTNQIFHQFHKTCIQKHLSEVEDCPTCHEQIHPDRVREIVGVPNTRACSAALKVYGVGICVISLWVGIFGGAGYGFYKLSHS